MDRKFLKLDKEAERIEERHELEDVHIEFKREGNVQEIRLSILDSSPSGFGA